MTARRVPLLPLPRSGMTTLRWAWLLVGSLLVPCLAGAISAVLRPNSDTWVGTAVLTLLAVNVTGALPGGWLDVVRAWTWRRRRARHVSEPWFADHAWDPRGARRSSFQRGLDQDLWAVVPSLAIVLIVGVALAAAPAVPLLRIGGLAIAAFVAWHTVKIARDLSRGALDVTFSRFPFVPGDLVELHVGALPGGPTLSECVLSLRRIEERPRSRWSWRPRVVPTYADQRVPTVAPGPDQYVVVSFDVPEGAGGTCLASLAPSYWELVVDAQVDGRRFLDRFLIPVYERPR